MSNNQATDGNKPDASDGGNSSTTFEESQDKLPTIIGKTKADFVS